MNSTKTGVKLFFAQGLPGFEHLRRFSLSKPLEESPFYYLQSEEDENICFLIVNPFEITKSYEFELPVSVTKTLDIKEQSDIIVFNIVNVREKLENATVNLQAPLIINASKNTGMQIVLSDNTLHIREPLKNLLQGKVV